MENKKTVGFLVGGIMDEFTRLLCDGLMDEAVDPDVNIVVFPVKYINRDMTNVSDKFEYQYATNVKNITADNVDVLIVAAESIGCLTTQKNLMKFMDSLPDIPTVLVASKIDGYPGVTFDNTQGIRDGLSFLIKELGVRRICMMKSSPDNRDAEERYDVYREILDRFEIPFEERMVVETNLSSKCRKEAEQILDQNPDAEAIFCVDDAVAMGLYDVMRERGIVPGKDIKVMGYDNSIYGTKINPSLTTVDANAYELGKHVFKLVRRMLVGKIVGHDTIPTKFLLRDSFGVILERGYSYEYMLDKRNLEELFYKLFYRYRYIAEKDDYRLLILYKTLMNTIIDYAGTQEYRPDAVALIEKKTDEFFGSGAIQYGDLDEIIAYISRLYGAIISMYRSTERRKMAFKTLTSIVRRIFKALTNESIENENRVNEVLYSMKNLVKDTLNFSYGNDYSYANIVSSLAEFGVKNAYVYIYDKPITHMMNEPFVIPDTVRLKVVLRDGEIINIPYGEQEISIDNLYNNEYITDSKFNMVIMPMYFGDIIYGSVLYDLTEITFQNGEFLVNQFATTARMIHLLKENTEIQRRLEENLALMSESNIKLERMSKNDDLTGIYNRRGFMDAAEKVLADGIGEGVLLSFVDMNNLKVINDRFGHDDGDYALRITSKLLTEVMGDEGFAARIGGDEFAFLYNGPMSKNELRKKISSKFDEFNLESDKPYNISVACGFYLFIEGDDTDLETALDNADQDLYIAKQFKDNQVFKDTDGEGF